MGFEGRTFQRDEIMYKNERFLNVREDGSGSTIYILEVDHAS